VLGTLGVGIQSEIGNVAPSSLFASAQAAAMGGGISVIFQAIGGVVAGIMGFLSG